MNEFSWLASGIVSGASKSCRKARQARERIPAWESGTKRDWTLNGPVTRNPERNSVVAAHSNAELEAAVGCLNEPKTTCGHALIGSATR